jgi:hypothetical protein
MIHREDGSEWATRFDVIRDMRLATHEVRYTDLLLDLWVEAGVAQWQDEDEVAEAEGAGRLAPGDSARIARAREVLSGGHTRVIAEARQTLRGVSPALA